MPAPERCTIWRSGAFALVVLLTSASCEGIGSDRPTLQLDGEEVRLGEGVALHEVRLGAVRGGAALEPDTVRARVGDVVRFVAADSRTYAVAFDAAALDGGARAFLERSGQLRSPPLVESGASWIVSLEGAPPGAYAFELPGGERGLLLVQAGSR